MTTVERLKASFDEDPSPADLTAETLLYDLLEDLLVGTERMLDAGELVNTEDLLQMSYLLEIMRHVSARHAVLMRLFGILH